MKRALINCTGFIGDILFASSIAEKLQSEEQFDKIDYNIQIHQPLELLSNNPFIDRIFIRGNGINEKDYNKIFTTPLVDQSQTPPRQFQEACGVKNPTDSFKVYTNKSFDYSMKLMIEDAVKDNIPIIAYLTNWDERSYLFTKEQYKKGIDVPNLGYGGAHRDIEYIINELSKKYVLLKVGFPSGTNQFNTGLNTTATYSSTASLLKHCDYFIGAEGGLANLASGVGTKTIITGDFVHQLYGWNGVIKKIKEPKLGPKYYFKEGHITLDPYLTDKLVVDNIIKIVDEDNI